MGMQSIGNIIKQERIRLGITQQQLCDGICEPSTMSKIENDEQNPSRSTFLALFQRLGIVADRFYCLHNFDELEKEDLKLQIKSANYRNEYATAISLTNRLEQNFSCSDNITKQFILYSKAINGQLIADEVVPYPAEDKAQMLLTAIKYTVPSFDINKIMSLFLALDEILIIVAFAGEHINSENYLEAINIYRQLLNYVQERMLPVTESGILIPLITANYSTALGRINQVEEELKIAEIGIKSCIEHGKSRLLGNLVLNKSCALHEKGDIAQAKHYCIRAYYLFSVLNKNINASMVKDYLLKTYQYETD